MSVLPSHCRSWRDTLVNELKYAQHENETISQLANSKSLNELQKVTATKNAEVQELKAKIDTFELSQKLIITEAVSVVEKERDELKNSLGWVEFEKQLAKQSLKDKYETQIKDRDDAIERLRDMKARLSTKMIAWQSVYSLRPKRIYVADGAGLHRDVFLLSNIRSPEKVRRRLRAWIERRPSTLERFWPKCIDIRTKRCAIGT